MPCAVTIPDRSVGDDVRTTQANVVRLALPIAAIVAVLLLGSGPSKSVHVANPGCGNTCVWIHPSDKQSVATVAAFLIFGVWAIVGISRVRLRHESTTGVVVLSRVLWAVAGALLAWSVLTQPVPGMMPPSCPCELVGP